ncbi:hypothetical protein SFC65_20345 [Priestia filamentosa]|uniref:hypothetical protein n=1 Tax=Priestia filamentosa TaxID=1402861 RepID=UPI0039827F44
MRLSEQLEGLRLNLSDRSFFGHLTSITRMKQRILNIVPENDQQQKQSIDTLEDIKKLITKQIEELQGLKFLQEEKRED